MNKIEENLPSLPFWDKLSSSEKASMQNGSVIKKCSDGEIISGFDTVCLGMTLVIGGVLRAYLLSEEGREITLFRIAAGELCILSASCVISQITFDTHIVAEGETELLVIPSGIFSTVVKENVHVRCFMYEKMTERFSSVMFTLQQILFMRFDSRLASFLINEYEQNGKSEIHMTHEQIAQRVNSAREVVARMLKRFSSEGLIEMKRGTIQITDFVKLEELIG